MKKPIERTPEEQAEHEERVEETKRHLERRILDLVGRHARRRRVFRAVKRLALLDPKRAHAFTVHTLYQKPAIKRASEAIAVLEPREARKAVRIVAASYGGVVKFSDEAAR